jgi:hypothetical protein
MLDVIGVGVAGTAPGKELPMPVLSPLDQRMIMTAGMASTKNNTTRFLFFRDEARTRSAVCDAIAFPQIFKYRQYRSYEVYFEQKYIAVLKWPFEMQYPLAQDSKEVPTLPASPFRLL